MKRLQNIITGLLLLSFTSAGAAPSGNSESVVVQRISAPEILAVDGKSKIFYGQFIRKQLAATYPNIEDIIIGDKRYLFITEKWFLHLAQWVDTFIHQEVPQLDSLDQPPVGYEETFALLMSNVANIAVAKRYDLKASVTIGLMVAKSKNPWGAIPADGQPRTYVVGLTEHGAIVYDIATRQMIPLKQFPNKETMRGIML